MSYAVRKDGLGFRAVNSEAECGADENFSPDMPEFTSPPVPNVGGFIQAAKTALGGILSANALAVSYPLFFPAVQSQVWADVQAIIVDASAKTIISSTQYTAIKSAAEQFDIPITL